MHPVFLPISFPWPGDELVNHPENPEYDFRAATEDLQLENNNLKDLVYLLEERVFQNEQTIDSFKIVNRKILNKLGEALERVEKLEKDLVEKNAKDESRIKVLEKSVSELIDAMSKLEINH